jgi:hypothetical protein
MRHSPGTLLCILVILVAGSGCSRPPHHPTDASTEGLPAKISQPVEFVLASTNDGNGSLLSAHIVDPSPGLVVVATGLVQSGDVANGEPYPPKHPVTPLPADYQGSTLVAFAIRGDRPGNYDGLGVVLTWTSDGETHSSYQSTGVRLCVAVASCDPSPVTDRIHNVNTDKAISELGSRG